MASQLEIQQALTKAVASRNELLKEQSRLVKSQLADVMGLKEAWASVDPKQGDILKTIKDMRAALDDVGEGFDLAGSSGQLMTGQIANKILKAKTVTGALSAAVKGLTGTFPLAAAAGLGFVDGVTSGFKYVKNLIVSTGSLIMAIGKGIKDTGLSIAAIPFKSLSALIATSNKLIPLLEAVARATEEVRRQFGDIATGAGRDIISTANVIGDSFKSMGLDGFAVFGSLDERIQAVNKLATGLGANFDNFRTELVAGGGAIMFLQRGLGLTEEVMGQLAKRAKAMGTSITTQLKEMTKFSIEFGKRFGISQKLISRDMGAMATDAKHFGNVGPAELGKVSVYARKLGLDVKELLGVVEKFDTFESAAESAAMLSQAFGANVDAIALMRAKNPAEQIDMLRQAFFAAGKSADALSRQELRLLAQTVGMTEEAARAALSQQNFGAALKDVDAQGKILEKRTITTEEAIANLQTSIERVIKPFRQFTGFISDFANGFARGLLGADGFRKMLESLRGALHGTYSAGMRVGEMFFKTFPSIRTFTESLATVFKTGDGFEPFTRMLTTVTGAFSRFFVAIKGGPEAVRVLLMDLQGAFKTFLGTFNASNLKGPTIELTKTFGNIVAGATNAFAEGLVVITKLITDLISGKDIPNVPGGGLARAFIDPIVKEFKKKDGPLRQVVPAIMDLFKALWKEHGEDIQKALSPVALGIAAAMFGSGLVKAAGAILVTSLTNVMMQSLVPWLADVGVMSIKTALISFGESMVAIITSPFLLIPAAIGAAIATSYGVSQGMDKFRTKLSDEFGKTESMVGAAAAGVVQTMSLGLINDSTALRIAEVVAGATKYFFSMIEKLPFGKSIVSSLKTMAASVIDTFDAMGKFVSAIFSGDSLKIAGAASRLAESITVMMTDGLSTLMTTLPKLIGSILLQVGSWLVKGLAVVVTQAVPLLAMMIAKAGQTILNTLAGVVKGLGDVVGKIPIIGTIIKPVFELVGGFLGLLSDVAMGFSVIFRKIAENGQNIRQFIGNLLGSVYGVISEWVYASWAVVTDFFSFPRASKVAMDIIHGIDSALKRGVMVFKTWAFESFANLINWLGAASPLDRGMQIGRYIVDGVKAGLSTVKDVVVSPFKDALAGIKDVFGIKSPSKETKELGRNITEGLLQGVNSIPGVLTNNSTEMLDRLATTIDASMAIIMASLFQDVHVPSYDPENAPVVKAIRGMIDEANALQDAFQSLSQPIDIDAKIERIGKALGLKDKELKIERKNLQVNLRVNVTLEADKLAKVLAEHGLVSTERF